ncbi:MAG: alpha/beta hydrolase [Pseudomonadota bacterium]
MSAYYFHGLPGGPEKLEIVPEVSLTAVPWLKGAMPRGAGLHLVGFSLGARRALAVAAAQEAARVDLIAPAAPLALGNFLPHMAGRAVFEAAQRGGWALRSLVLGQNLASRVGPEWLISQMFKGAQGAEVELAADPEFRGIFKQMLQRCIGIERSAYKNALRAAVAPWQGLLLRVTCSVTLWHGTDDTWAPLAMSEALSAALPKTELRRLPGLGHYSALKAALTQVAPA